MNYSLKSYITEMKKIQTAVYAEISNLETEVFSKFATGIEQETENKINELVG